MSYLIDFILHIDEHLLTIVNMFGDWTYLILFAIIFVETGVVIMPFLPGDSLLFAAAAMAANPKYHLDIWIFVACFFIASMLGDSSNYAIGHKVGHSLTKNSFLSRFIRKDDLVKTELFFEKHGGKAIIIARFMPIIRTLVPFVAASSGFPYKTFLHYNLLGNVLWVIICCSGGYFFGNFTIVKEHFSLIILGIIVVSLIPAVVGALKARLSK